MFNDSIRYVDGLLHCDSVVLNDIAVQIGTPTYVYSFCRVLDNYHRIEAAFPGAHIHYSVKANGNLALLQLLNGAGAGMDCVSAGEIYRALLAGTPPEKIVFAGVGKTAHELYYALEQNIGWFNIENEQESRLLNSMAGVAGKTVRAALRLNPGVTANTHPHIATGHGGAKFGLTDAAVRDMLDHADDTPNLRFEGLHIHIGSQLHDTDATVEAVRAAVDLARAYPTITTLDIGGGLPVAYTDDEALPSFERFAGAVLPLLEGYQVILEPGRAIVADAGALLTRVIYRKSQGGADFVIVDAGMNDLMRPALYEAHHEIVPLKQRSDAPTERVQIVGPVCETTDIFARDRDLPHVEPEDCLAILTAGAYGMTMASQYNARPRSAEVAVAPSGESWYLVRRRETWQDLVAHELAP